jgi:type IV pilus assembly protein PilC
LANAKSRERQAGRRRRTVRGARKIVAQELPNFSRQMSAMLSAGVPIVASLDALHDQLVNPNFKAVVNDVKVSLEGGSSFSEAIAAFPAVFDDLYVNMARSGETGGQLAESMGRIATFLEASTRLKKKVKSAMMYPLIVLSISIAIATGMILFIVPVFSGMYGDFGAKLPGPTQFLVNLSANMKKYGVVIVAVLIVVVFLFKRWKRTATGAYALDRFYLQAPAIGELVKKISVARFARTFAQLIRSGVPILGALETVAGATGNKVIGQAILEARAAVERGDPLSSALAGKSCIPGIVVRMLAAGEQTGRVDEMMDSVADFYDSEIETTLAGLTSLIEPLLMVFLGVVVGGIVLCLFLPIFKLGEIVGGG